MEILATLQMQTGDLGGEQKIELLIGLDLALHTRVLIDPVHLPRLASVYRKGLFGLRRIAVNAPNGEPDKDKLAINVFIVVEITSTILEFSNGRHTDRADVRSCKV